jgi:hypothetical protein
LCRYILPTTAFPHAGDAIREDFLKPLGMRIHSEYKNVVQPTHHYRLKRGR